MDDFSSTDSFSEPDLPVTEEDASKEKNERTPWITYVISFIVMLAVAVAWVAATQFSKYALQFDKKRFFAPYFMMWLNTSFMLTCYPVFLLYSRLRGVDFSHAHKRSLPILSDRLWIGGVRVLFFVVLWTGANYPYTRSLDYITASTATSISSCNAAVVYLLALLVLGDSFLLIKFMTVIFAVGGVILISLDGQISAQWAGVLLALLSALCSACYKVFFKRLVGDASLGEVCLFLSCIGFTNLVLNAIPAFALGFSGVEKLDLAAVPWLQVIIAGLLSLAFNFLVNFGIALLHPLVISIGMLFGLPLNTSFDMIFHDLKPSVFIISGSALIIFSFLFMIFPYGLVCKRRLRYVY